MLGGKPARKETNFTGKKKVMKAMVPPEYQRQSSETLATCLTVEAMNNHAAEIDMGRSRGYTFDKSYDRDGSKKTEGWDEMKTTERFPSSVEDMVSNDSSDIFREEIAGMPFGKVKQLKEELGIKLFSKAFFGESTSGAAVMKTTCPTFTRGSAKKPREVSSKMRVPNSKNMFSNEKKKRFDPRFDERCGEFSSFIFPKNYSFLEEMKQEEKKILMDELRKVRGMNSQYEYKLREALKRINNQERSQKDAERRKEVIREVRHENNERMRQGLPPVYKTRGQLRMLVWKKKYDDLNGSKRLEKYMHRRAKKQDRNRCYNNSVNNDLDPGTCRERAVA